MERIFGVPAADAIGRVVWAVLPIRPASNDEAAFRATLAGERHSSYDREFRLPDGSRAGVIDAHYSPLQDEHGNVTGGLMIVRDVTRRARANEARETAERAADRSRRLQALTAALSEVATVEQVADVIVYKGMEAIGADAGRGAHQPRRRGRAAVRDRAHVGVPDRGGEPLPVLSGDARPPALRRGA
jgi:PAS domain S-box-containing protein